MLTTYYFYWFRIDNKHMTEPWLDQANERGIQEWSVDKPLFINVAKGSIVIFPEIMKQYSSLYLMMIPFLYLQLPHYQWTIVFREDINIK